MMELRELKPIMILKYVQTRFREAQNAGGSLGLNRPRHLVSASANQELRLSLKSGRRMGGMDTAGQPWSLSPGLPPSPQPVRGGHQSRP